MSLFKDLKHDKEFDTKTLFTDIGPVAGGTKETTDRKTIAESEIMFSADQRTQEYQPRPLTPDDDIYEDIIEQFASAPTKPKYWFEEFGDYWSCSCGHINKGDKCKSCGLERELLRSLFILHKPANAPGKLDRKLRKAKSQADKENERQAEKENRMKKREASGEDITKVVPIEEDSGTQTSEANTDKKTPSVAKPSAFNKKIIIAIGVCAALAAAGGIAIYFQQDAASAQNQQVQTLQTDLHSLETLGAHAASLCLDDMTPLTDTVNAAKFTYVQEHLSKGDAQAETYMSQLMAIHYPGIQEIYDEYYAWHVSIVANTSEDDFSTDLETVSRKDTIYFHTTLSGGEPDETIELYYEVTWPNGSSQIYDLDSLWQDGSRISARFQYPIPLFGAEGKLTFNLYDKSANELLGSDTVTFRN